MRWHRRCVIPWGPMSGPCQTKVVQKTAVVLGGKPSYLFTGSYIKPDNPVSENRNPLSLSRLGIQKMRLVWLPWSLGGLFLSAVCFQSCQRTWEIWNDPFRDISWMPLSVHCWAEANALFYVFNSGRTSPPPQQSVSADSCSWEGFVWEPGRSDSGQQLLGPVTGWTWSCPCRAATELKAQRTSLPMLIFK